MALSLELVGLLFIVLVNAGIAALLTRFLRVRLHTRWGSAIYIALLVPVVLVVTTFVLAGVFGIGADVGSRMAVIGLTIVVPMALGVAFDYFWMPAPEEVDLPDKYDRDRQPRRSR